jgi:hypothetical protein
VKVDKVGFETFMRPYGYFEYTCSARLLKTDKLLVTEGDHTEIVFDINAVAQSMGEALSSKTLTYAPQMLKMWLYLTHGSRISVEVDSKIDELLRQAIVSAVATSSKSRTG